METAFAVRREERVLDTGGHRGLRPQFPVGDGVGGEINDVDRHEVVGRRRPEVLAARVNVADAGPS